MCAYLACLLISLFDSDSRERFYSLKSIFEKKLGVWQNLDNTFKNFKNHL